MICQNCKQAIANVQIVQTINGEKSVMFLCESCAAARQEIIMNSHFNISDLLSSIMESLQGFSKIPVKDKVMQCDKCGMTFEEFTRIGKFGCSNCYEAFASRLAPIFRRIHGSTKHTGKVPAKYMAEKNTIKEIQELRSQLEQLVKEEQYEKAAQLRDRIRFLENEQGKDGR